MTRSSGHIWRWCTALLLAVSMVAAACGGDDDDGSGTDGTSDADTEAVEEPSDEPELIDPAEEVGDPVAGGTLAVGLDSEVDGLNPTNNAFDVSGLQMGITVFDTLTVHNEDNQPVPFLAESLTPNEDFTEWTVKLREGVTFHDGEPLNAAAVEAAFAATLSSPLVSLALLPIMDPEDATEVVDDLTVILKTKVPTAHFPSDLTEQLGMIPSPKWLAEIAENQDLAQKPVGTGPFKFESRVQDDKTVFVRNEDWWGNEVFGTETYLDTIEYYPIDNTDTRTTSLLTGATNGSHTTVASSIGKLREEEESGNVRNLIDETGEESFVMMNSSENGSDAADELPNPFQHIEARKALTLATPRQQYINLIGLGELTPADQMFLPSQPFYAEGVVQEADDPEGARAIAEEFCADPAKAEFCDDGKINMQFKYVGGSQNQDDLADLLTGAWGDAGFNVDITNTKQDTYITEVALDQYQVVSWRQFGSVDPDSDVVYLQCEAIGVASLNWPRLCDPERDELIAAQRSTQDATERTPIWADIVQNMHDAYTYVFLIHSKWVNSYAPEVRGLCSAPATAEGDLQRCTVNGRTPYQTVWIDPAA